MINSLDHLIIAVNNLDEAENNYKKIFGMEPVWRGEHKELGTSNSLFNFNNTYFELLSATGDGLGAALVNYYLDQDGEGLIGLVLGTDNIEGAASSIREKGYVVAEPTLGEGSNFKDNNTRKSFNNHHYQHQPDHFLLNLTQFLHLLFNWKASSSQPFRQNRRARKANK